MPVRPSGTLWSNQRGAGFEPTSSERSTPHCSRGLRGDAIRRACLGVAYLFWTDPMNDLPPSMSGAWMVHVPEWSNHLPRGMSDKSHLSNKVYQALSGMSHFSCLFRHTGWTP